MSNAIEEFRYNMTHVRSLGGLYRALSSMLTSAVDASDILRSQHVLAVSALDHYIHEAVREGMLDVFDGRRAATPAFLRFRVSMDTVSFSRSRNNLRSSFENEIRNQHSYLAFQHPDKIADALRLITEKKIWDCVARCMGEDAQAVKERLRLAVERRNKIAHEADRDPSYPKTRWPISYEDVNSVVDFISSLTESIHKEISG